MAQALVCRIESPFDFAQGIGWVGFSVGLLMGVFIGVVTYCGVWMRSNHIP